MKLSNIEQVQGLQAQLNHADATLEACLRMGSQGHSHCEAYACTEGPGAYSRRFTVPLMPVDMELVISSARREREKIVSQLRQLGVEVE